VLARPPGAPASVRIRDGGGRRGGITRLRSAIVSGGLARLGGRALAGRSSSRPSREAGLPGPCLLRDLTYGRRLRRRVRLVRRLGRRKPGQGRGNDRDGDLRPDHGGPVSGLARKLPAGTVSVRGAPGGRHSYSDDRRQRLALGLFPCAPQRTPGAVQEGLDLARPHLHALADLAVGEPLEGALWVAPGDGYVVGLEPVVAASGSSALRTVCGVPVRSETPDPAAPGRRFVTTLA
jgi:hypothetical protein